MTAKLLTVFLLHLTFYSSLVTFVHKKLDIKLKQVIKTSFIGLICITPIFLIMYLSFINKTSLTSFSGVSITYLVLAFIEEFHKNLPLFNTKSIIKKSIIVGICFALIENIVYSVKLIDNTNLITIISARLLLDTGIHIVSSLIFAFIYKNFKQKKSFYIISVLGSTLVHFAFNILQINGLIFLNIPMLFILGYFIYSNILVKPVI